jgi:lipopolysaccharide transport system ATP-binding protein
MSSDSLAIDLVDVSKVFHVYDKPSQRLAQALMPRLSRALPARLGSRWARRRYAREFWALQNINLKVRKGDSVGIIGRNGSGKSTLLQVIAGTLAATSGTATVRGRVAALLELGSGFNPDFTGRENVILNGMILGLTEREVNERFDAIAAFADIGTFIDQPVRTYSSGMMLRLAFSVQTQVEPDILIVDEALAVGDALFQKRCFQQMEALRANGCTLLLVSHDQESIRTLTDHAILLRDGKIRCSGPSSEVVLEYRRHLHEDERTYYAALTAQHLNHSETRTRAIVRADPAVLEGANPADQLSFGDLDCVIESVIVKDANGDECSYFLPGETVVVEVAFKPKQDMRNLNVNLRLRNKEGVKIYSWGTLNQDMHQAQTDPTLPLIWDEMFSAGETAIATFIFDCALGLNFYEVQASVSEELDRFGGAQRMLHWRDEAAFFQVGMRPKEYVFGGVADLRMRVQVSPAQY